MVIVGGRDMDGFIQKGLGTLRAVGDQGFIISQREGCKAFISDMETMPGHIESNYFLVGSKLK